MGQGPWLETTIGTLENKRPATDDLNLQLLLKMLAQCLQYAANRLKV